MTHWIRRVKNQASVRIHASMEGYAIWYLHTLGLADARINRLVERLLETQWPDGGWNCDVEARGDTSSFTESILPLRGLALHAQRTGDAEVHAAALRAAQVFLDRQLFKRKRDGHVIRSSFQRLCFPNYWHYDLLFGLLVMTEAGLIADPRCSDALDMLESKQLPRGGWAAEGKYYRVTHVGSSSGRSPVAWGTTGQTKLNEFVTTRALVVLKASGRFAV
jgi:hypothetical protein